MGCFNYICSATNTPIVDGDQVALFVVEETTRYDGIYSNIYSMLNSKTISLPFIGTYDDYGTIKEKVTNKKNESLIDRDKLKNHFSDDLRTYFVMMHLDAYNALKSYDIPNISYLWSIKENLSTMRPRDRDEPENFFMRLFHDSANYDTNKFARFFIQIFSNVSNISETPAKLLLKALEDSKTQKEFMEAITPTVEFLNLIDNMGRTGLNFNYPDYGRQEEEYGLIRQLKQIGLNKTSSQIVSDLDENYFYVDVPKEEYTKNQSFEIPSDVNIFTERMTWDIANPEPEVCDEGFVRVYCYFSDLKSAQFSIQPRNKKEESIWKNSPQNLVDALENKLIIQLTKPVVLDINNPEWGAHNSNGEEIFSSYEYIEQRKKNNKENTI